MFDLDRLTHNRDPLLYKIMKIIKGPNKGYQGEVRAVGNGVLIVVIEVNHHLERILIEYARYVVGLQFHIFILFLSI